MKRLMAALAVTMATPALADDPGVGIRPDVMSVTVPTRTGEAEISRIQDPAHELSGEWARTSRPCPDFCIQPMSPAEGVTTIGELELLEMLADAKATVIDSRTVPWFEQGSIPGAVNMPYTEMVDRLGELGCEIDFDGWTCENARTVALFCNGPWCGQSPAAIRRMIEAGYPAERIHYYRGGMQVWRLLGLSVTDGAG
ncbi:Rhodanese-related sulfurtransferase [Rhodovulum sp. ES.010]|uniref:rhodanese-like domain-containing protein n=1 Tax=Rhodovulum sp. ES.010 TaxID=1882821 RepID=UPI0009277D9A|nr:rhodanese-like domain-containing protein [Rhodovulum sp. ES.010]SIO52968.1 Rhodanese-related sulfurtransferase [Rhodovulum sp. ES.010]